MHRWTTLLTLAVLTAVSVHTASAQNLATPTLGPKDGDGMSPLDTGRVTVGKLAPDFTLEARDGGTVTLSQFRGRKKVVLVFYRGHW